MARLPRAKAWSIASNATAVFPDPVGAIASRSESSFRITCSHAPRVHIRQYIKKNTHIYTAVSTYAYIHMCKPYRRQRQGKGDSQSKSLQLV